MSLETIMAVDRPLLDRRELLSLSPSYARLRTALVERMGPGFEAWLAYWLLLPAAGLGLIDSAEERGGIDVLAEHLGRIAYDCA